MGSQTTANSMLIRHAVCLCCQWSTEAHHRKHLMAPDIQWMFDCARHARRQEEVKPQHTTRNATHPLLSVTVFICTFASMLLLRTDLRLCMRFCVLKGHQT